MKSKDTELAKDFYKLEELSVISGLPVKNLRLDIKDKKLKAILIGGSKGYYLVPKSCYLDYKYILECEAKGLDPDRTKEVINILSKKEDKEFDEIKDLMFKSLLKGVVPDDKSKDEERRNDI